MRRKRLTIQREAMGLELEATKIMAANARTEIQNRVADLDYLDTKIVQLEGNLKKIDDELEALGS